MKQYIYLFAGALGLGLAACNSTETTDMNKDELQPPVAKKIPYTHTEHGNKREDPYFWMRLSDAQKNAEQKDSQTLDVLAYLDSENAYTEAVLKHTEGFQKQIFEEIKGRIKEDDESVPYLKNGFWYYTRYKKGNEYAYYCRNTARDKSSETEELLLDGPALAAGHDYWALGASTVSTNNKILGFSIDTVSRRVYTAFFKNLETGELLPDRLEGLSGSLTWANDNKTVFYVKKDPVTLRSSQIWRHSLGSPQSEDVLVYEEKDETFSSYIYKSKSQKYIIIASSQTVSSEYRILDADSPEGEFRVFHARERELEYSIDHYKDRFYVITNLEAKNFRLMSCPLDKTSKEHWQELVPHRSDVLLEGLELFADYLVLEERQEGLNRIRIMPWDKSKEEHYIEFPDPAYSAGVGTNLEFESDELRLGYTSLTTPNSVFDYNMSTKERKLLKQQEIPDGSFSIENYKSERIYAKARDGAQVPVSLVYHKDTKIDGRAPLLLYAYGSYGSSMDAYFSVARLSLLDRGFVYAIAHIRGGQEMGRHWYEDGKLLKKKNTFTDFIDCGEYLIAQNYAAKDKLFAMGGSAGGLLMGAIMNMRPDLWRGVVASVPFVDVVSTMLDESIPLTTGEFDEWGNPKNKEYYDYMLSYSPYDNIEAKDYPNTLVLTGYWDSQVQYWEPAKWVARLRELKTDKNRLLFRCNMDAGHGGKSGRFEALKEVALEYVFMLDLLGIEK